MPKKLCAIALALCIALLGLAPAKLKPGQKPRVAYVTNGIAYRHSIETDVQQLRAYEQISGNFAADPFTTTAGSDLVEVEMSDHDFTQVTTNTNERATDVGDISWHVPTSGLSTACFAIGSPGHSWQNVAAIGSPIGHKGMMVAAKVLALSAVELFQDPQALKDTKSDFQERMKGRTYTTKIPKGQSPPKAIR